MKRILLFFLLFFTIVSFSQEKKEQKLFYSFTVNGTIARNTNYGEYDYYTGEKDRNIFAVGAIFLRNGLEIRLSKIVTTGFKIGVDYHSESEIVAIPYYIDTKITISEVDDDVFYVGGGVGKLLKISEAFEKGNYFKFGIGYNISTERPHKFILSLDFHQKKITDFEKGKLNSLSIGFGMLF